MDDISKLQKINQVARELMKHGQAQSMDEAVKKATAQVEGGSVLQQAPVQPAVEMPEAPEPEEEQTHEDDQMSEGTPEPEPAAQVEMPRMEGGADMSRIIDQQQSIISSMTNAVNAHSRQMDDMNNKINGLIAELTSMKSELQTMKESPVSPPMKKRDAEHGQTQFKQEAAQPAEGEKKPKGEGHARTGNYNPDDVSIEKFFYYGGK